MWGAKRWSQGSKHSFLAQMGNSQKTVWLKLHKITHFLYPNTNQNVSWKYDTKNKKFIYLKYYFIIHWEMKNKFLYNIIVVTLHLHNIVSSLDTVFLWYRWITRSKYIVEIPPLHFTIFRCFDSQVGVGQPSNDWWESRSCLVFETTGTETLSLGLGLAPILIIDKSRSRTRPFVYLSRSLGPGLAPK